jgi:serine/threonine protein kinase/Tfp pilus assembly protein PilF
MMKCEKCGFENTDNTRFCGNCGGELDSIEKAPISLTKTLETPSDEFTRGTSFAGRYEIIEELGAGGMGKVFRAFDTKIKVEIALKILKPEIVADKKTIERFSNEIRFARDITHKNVCRMHDLNEDEGTQYITMEYVPGEDLKNFIKRVGQLPAGKAITIAKQICDGLSEAHRLGVVHRDLKPHNIMIDKEGNAKIMDFGIARSLKTEGITREGTIIGTPEYMSPEQVEGQEADQRSDIYSLGIILYEMTTGQVPFQGDTAFSIAMKHKTEDPLHPKKFNIQTPDDLAHVILKCMEKKKEDRYQSAGEILSALQTIETDTTSTIADKTKKRPENAHVKKPKHLILISAIVVIVVAIIFVGYFISTRLRQRPKLDAVRVMDSLWENSIAVLPFRDNSVLQDQEPICDAMTEAIIGRLTRLKKLKVISFHSMMAYKNTARDIKNIGQELNVLTVLDGSIQMEKKNIRINAQLIDAEDASNIWSDSFDRQLESIFDLQDDISQSIVQALQLELGPKSISTDKKSPPINLEAYEYYMKGMHYTKSKFVLTFKDDDFKAGVEMFNKALEIDPDYMMAYFGLAWAYEHHYQVTGSMEDLETAQKMSDKAFALDPDSAKTNALQGYYHYEHKLQFDKAFEFLKKAIELGPNEGEVNFIAGAIYLYHGLYELAIPLLQKAIELDPYYFWTPYKLGICYMYTGEFEKAATSFENYFELTPIQPLMLPGRYIYLNIMMSKYDKVEKLLTEAEEQNPGATWTNKYWAILQAAKGNRGLGLSLEKNIEVLAILGMKDEAIDLLDAEILKRKIMPYIYYLDLLNNPFYDNLRDDPHFEEMVEREKALYEEASEKYSLGQFQQ